MTISKTELVERLAKVAGQLVIATDGMEQLHKERQDVLDAMREAADFIEQSISPDHGVREALEPFAKVGQMIDGPFGPALFRDDQAIGIVGAWKENGETRTITFGDLRRARDALASLNKESGRG